MFEYNNTPYTKENKTNMIMSTIKFLNDTFCPLGMKPVEDLPEAVPCQGNSCVVAKVIADNFIDFSNVQVGLGGIELNPGPMDDLENKDLANFIEYDSSGEWPTDNDFINIPEEVKEFIYGYDHGQFPELVSVEETIDRVGAYDAVHVYGVDKKNCDCSECNEITDGRYGYNGY